MAKRAGVPKTKSVPKKGTPKEKSTPRMKFVELSNEDLKSVKMTMESMRSAYTNLGAMYVRHKREESVFMSKVQEAGTEQNGVIDMIRKKLELPEGVRFEIDTCRFVVPLENDGE